MGNITFKPPEYTETADIQKVVKDIGNTVNTYFAQKPTVKSIELTKENWKIDETNKCYQQEVKIEHYTGKEIIHVSLATESSKEIRDMTSRCSISCISQNNNTLTFVADTEKPTENIPITIVKIGETE